MNDLLQNLPGEETVTVQQPFTPKEVVVTCSRTIQISQYNPFTPSVAVTMSIHDPNALPEAIRDAMLQARNGIREAFASVIPSILQQMDSEFIAEFIRLATPQQKKVIQSQITPVVPDAFD